MVILTSNAISAGKIWAEIIIILRKLIYITGDNKMPMPLIYMPIQRTKNQKGTSLLELLVALSLFAMIILSATSIFKAVIDGQRNSISAQNVQESLRYALEKFLW